MGFCISSKAAKFFIEIIVLITIGCLIRVESYKYRALEHLYASDHPFESSKLRKKSIFESPLSTSEPNTPKPLPESSKRNTPKTADEYIITWIEAPQRVTDLLSPSTLKQADPFQYLLREVSKIQTWKLANLRIELDSRLNTNRISETVMPFARALKSIISVVMYLQPAKNASVGIRNNRRYTIPPEVSSPPAFSSYALFSSDVLTEPNVLFRLINKLVEIPKNEIPYVIIQLQDYVKMMKKWVLDGFVFWDYQGYAENVKDFLKYESSLMEDLKRNMAEIQRITDSNQNSVIGETGSSAR